MTRQEVIDALKTELSKSYTIRVTKYEDGKAVNTTDHIHPNAFLNFDRKVIEATLNILEGENDF